MQDEQLNNLLHDWSNAKLPDDETRDAILCGVLTRSQPADLRPPLLRLRRVAVALSGIAAIAATLLFMVILPQIDGRRQTADGSKEVVATQSPHTVVGNIQVSLIVLKQLPGSEAAVEFLEDVIFVAEKQQLHVFELGGLELAGHRLFLWIYPLEEELFSVDIGIDNVAETGIVAVPDRPQVLQFQSGGECFDVFVSVLPVT